MSIRGWIWNNLSSRHLLSGSSLRYKQTHKQR